MYYWLEAVLSSVLVSLASLVCLAMLPWLGGRSSSSTSPLPETTVQSLMAFAAGAMLGEACLHQLPQVFSNGGDHSHGTHNHQGHASGLLVFFGVLLFFMVECTIHQFSTSHRSMDPKAASPHPSNIRSDLEPASLSMPPPQPDVAHCRQRAHTIPLSRTPLLQPSSEPSMPDTASPGDAENKESRGWSSLLMLPKAVHPMAYLNLLADGVHNFTDGIALSTAFLSGGHAAGWRRTIIILVHELPQEIGDFGILVSSGLTPRQALAWNLVSAGTAVVGAAFVPLLGIWVLGGVDKEEAGRNWMSGLEALTAGGFLWIAVGDALPMLASKSGLLKSVCCILAGLAFCMLSEGLVH